LAARVKTLTAYYDLAIGPVSFDVLPFLIRARMAAEDTACIHVHVVIVPDAKGVGGMFRDKLHLYDEAEMRWRLWNLVIPACQLAGASVTLATDWAQARSLKTADVWPPDWDTQTLLNKRYLPRPIVDAARGGRNIPRLHASSHALKKVRRWFSTLGNVVTLTLRNTYEPSRNSDPVAWAALESAIKARGYAVVTMQDTDVALSRGHGFGELNLDLRMACYELASLNIAGNNGTSFLMWFSEAPFILMESSMPIATWRHFWVKHIGIDVDHAEQLPWARVDQRLVYESATAENMIRAFNQWAAA